MKRKLYDSNWPYPNNKSKKQDFEKKKFLSRLSQFDNYPIETPINERIKEWYSTGWKDCYREWDIELCDLCGKIIYANAEVNEIRTIKDEKIVFVDKRCFETLKKQGMKMLVKGERLKEEEEKKEEMVHETNPL